MKSVRINLLLLKNHSTLNKKEKTSKNKIEELEEKIIDLSLKLRTKNIELEEVQKRNKTILSKLIHNIKNPIGVIFSFSEIMLESAEDYTSDKLKKHAQIINNSADFSIQFLNSLANYTRIHSQNFNLNKSSNNYIETVQSAIAFYKETAAKKNIELSKNFNEKPIFLNIDHSEILKVLKAIIHNAIRYSKSNTTIKISISQDKKNITTTITDQGIGISEVDLPNLCNEFFVVNTYSEDKQKCIGLSLNLANKILKLHNGYIKINSIIEQGTSVSIILPIK